MPLHTPAIILPSELRYVLATFCSPGSLASLAQVHTSYQHEAERALYHTISIFTDSEEAKCLDTLSTHPRKASLVKSLTLEFPRKWNDELRTAGLESISKALRHTHALSNLRIRFPLGNYDPSQEQINDVLRSNCFKLRTLYCNDCLDIAGIIGGQPDLQFLGIYTHGGDENLLKKLKLLYPPDSPSTPPVIFGLERESYMPHFDHLTIFPAFYVNSPIMCRAIVESLDQDIGRRMFADATEVSQVSIYLRDFSDMTLIRSIVEDMARCFPPVHWLILRVEGPSRVRYTEITKILAPVKQLRELDFSMWDLDAEVGEWGELSHDLKVERMKEWKAVCRDLSRVSFLDGVTLTTGTHDVLWRVFEQ